MLGASSESGVVASSVLIKCTCCLICLWVSVTHPGNEVLRIRSNFHCSLTVFLLCLPCHSSRSRPTFVKNLIMEIPRLHCQNQTTYQEPSPVSQN
ncbi:hypothetical protein XELAEV_18004177mg [Xenopus laevis]|uniref:Uncharacterized protein n=1 Tax=Xenopus laevis TaxID=8355 RepID=A0A974BS02_XENLA|nr:hypothetical protein XELAEV_18004177mg [Xenopus laevis]